MWQDEQVYPHTMDHDLKTLKDTAHKAYHTPQLFTHYHSLKVKDMQHKF